VKLKNQKSRIQTVTSEVIQNCHICRSTKISRHYVHIGREKVSGNHCFQPLPAAAESVFDETTTVMMFVDLTDLMKIAFNPQAFLRKLLDAREWKYCVDTAFSVSIARGQRSC